MHLCMITEYFPESAKGELRGGVEARAFHLAQQLAERHAVTVITSYESGSRRTHAIGKIRIIRCGPHRYTHRGAFLARLRFARSVQTAFQELRDQPPDIIEGENFLCYLPAFTLAHRLKAKAVATYHEVWIGSWMRNKGLLTGALGSIWERLALRKPWDKLIAVSSFTKHRLIQCGIPPARIAVVPNGVDLSACPAGDLLPTKYPQPTVCCIARLTDTKHVDVVLRAVAELRKAHPKLQLKIIGVGDEEPPLRALASQLGINQAVEFLGFLPSHAAMIGVLARSHLFCTASTVEGFGIALLEAMACGIPYAATRIPVFEEITAKGRGGLLFKPGDAQDCAEKMAMLLTHRDQYERKAAEGKKHAAQYSWERIAQQLEDTYASL